MATYNGAQFLDRQLATIVSQSVAPQRILIVDDSSGDHTLEIIQRWKKSQSIPIELIAGTERSGCCKAFERALLEAQADYVMPADQDDLWDPDKAEVLLEEMLRLEDCWGNQCPLIVHTDLRLINHDELALGDCFYERVGLDPRCDSWQILALQNVVTGCTIIANRSCLNQALPFPDGVVLHDWWLALVAKRFGHVGFISRPTVSYRQHNANVVGARSFLQRHTRSLLLLVTGRRHPGSFVAPSLAQLQAFANAYHSRLSSVEWECLNNLLHPSLAIRIKAALTLRLQKQGWIRTLAFYACLAWPGSLPLAH